MSRPAAKFWKSSLAATILSLAFSSVLADDYVLENLDLDATTDYLFHIEPDPAVCQLYLENLNHFGHKDVPMSCNRPIAPKLNGRIQAVKWENLRPADYPELFRQVVLFTSHGHERSPKELDRRAQMVKTGDFVFRRAKLSLIGSPMGQTEVYGEPDRSHNKYNGTFYVVQFGNNVTDTDRPHEPCKPVRGNWPGDDPTGALNMYLVNAGMDEVIESLSTLSRGQQGEHMRLIDGKPYVEGILADGTVRLFRVRTKKGIFLEQLCQYRFESSCLLPKNKAFDPEQPMCKPNLQ